jgi:hypothetical protein
MLWAEWFNLELDHDIEIRNRFTLDPPFVAHSDFHPQYEKPGYNAFSNLQNQCKQDLHPTWRLHDRSIQKIKREKLNTKKIKKYMSSPYVSQKKKWDSHVLHLIPQPLSSLSIGERVQRGTRRGGRQDWAHDVVVDKVGS